MLYNAGRIGDSLPNQGFPRKRFSQKTSHRLEQTRAWVHNQDSDIRTSAAFSIIKDREDILRYARDRGGDLIVAPPAYESLFDKACCLVDAVAAEEKTFADS